MGIMNNSGVDDAWLRDVMQKNPPSVIPSNGNLFSGPVRLAFVNLFQPGRPQARGGGGDDAQEPKYNVALLFPPGTSIGVFETAWTAKAREAFPKNFGPDGRPVGLHYPFHQQDEKAYGAKPLQGFTPGALYLNVSSKYKPPIVDARRQEITDESRVYAGCWAFVSLNVYSYRNLKTGVGFGIQSVMVFADDQKLTGGGGNPDKDFDGVTITAQANVAAKFDQIRREAVPAETSVMQPGGHAGHAGHLQTHALPRHETDAEREARMIAEMGG